MEEIQVKSAKGFKFRNLGGMKEWNRRSLRKRGLGSAQIVKLGRGVAHDLTNGSKTYSRPRTEYMQELADALEKHGYIRHDLDPMTLRLLWFYHDIMPTINGAERDDWFNWAYENAEQLNPNLLHLIRTRIINMFADEPFAVKHPLKDELNSASGENCPLGDKTHPEHKGFALQLLDWYGLIDQKMAPGSVRFAEECVERPEEAGIRGVPLDMRSNLFETLPQQIYDRLPQWMGIGGAERMVYGTVMRDLDEAREILARRHFLAGDQMMRERLVEMAGMPFGPDERRPDPNTPMTEVPLPLRIHQILEENGVRKVSDIHKRWFRYKPFDGMRGQDWQALRRALTLAGFGEEFTRAVPPKPLSQ